MCGIAGILQQNPVPQLMVKAMLGSIRHRGPDQFGIYLFQNEACGVGLGHARLSIIDLSSGQQPLGNEDETLWIVFNGEIFNYIELRPILEAQGHRLATQSDTEVILHLYEQYGPACVHHLNGQFAFVIWDERTQTLFAARDRLGVRPFYYTWQNGRFLFASEIKALLATRLITAELDPLALDQIFTYWSPLSPHTAFQNIHTLPPGHTLLLKPGHEPCLQPYWQLTFPIGHAFPFTFEEASHQLRHLLIDATRIRLRADVPVAAYLSGGLDSSAITALVRRYTGNHLETFSVGFSDPTFDERQFQQQMADHLGTTHHTIICTPEEIGHVFPSVIWHTELPLLRTAPVPLYLLSQLVQEDGFKVVLTGEGADEFLAGYNIFKEAQIRRFWARQPQSTWRPALLKKLYPYIGSLAQGGDAYLQKFFGRGLTDVDAPDYSHQIRWHNTSRTKRLFSPELQALLSSFSPQGHRLNFPPQFGQWHPLARAQYLEITLFLAEYLLSAQGDRVAMAHSVEGRFPFLDYRVVEFCNQLPASFKLLGLHEKHILKQAMRDLLPETVWKRPKRPYRAPIHTSFFPQGRPLEWVANLLSPAALQTTGYFDATAVMGLVNKLERTSTLGETDDMALVGVLSTQLVHHQFVSHFYPPPPLTETDDIKMVTHGLL